MSDPIYVHGEARITPPLAPADATLTVGDWYVGLSGSTLAFTEEHEGYAHRYDDDLKQIVALIHERGSRVNGAFEWAMDETEFGKTVITEGKIVEYEGFRAYTDGSTEDGRRIQIIEEGE